MIEIKIDEEFKNLIPPLSADEFTQLEENILRDGIQDPLKVWQGVLIDGHNRYSIAQKHNLEFTVTDMQFDNKDEVKAWIIKNQFGRRNISVFSRVCLALKLKPVISAKAKENQGNRQDLTFDPKKSKVDTLQEIAKLAGVGKETVRKVEKIQEVAKYIEMSDVLTALKQNEISINLAYELAIQRKSNITEVTEVTEDIKNFIAESIENYQKANEKYKLFCEKFETATPEEKEKYSKVKAEIENCFIVSKEYLKDYIQ